MSLRTLAFLFAAMFVCGDLQSLHAQGRQVCVVTVPCTPGYAFLVPVSDTSCPTTKIAEFTVGIPGSTGNPMTICVWELTNCTTMPPTYAGMIYSDCSITDCDCNTTTHTCNCNPSQIDLGVRVVVNDEQLIEGGTQGMPATTARVMKRLFSNNYKFAFELPTFKSMVPPQGSTDGIMPGLGAGNFRVKYLKTIKRTVRGIDEYSVLYKIFDSTNGDEAKDLTTHRYVGIRTLAPGSLGEIPGGVAELVVNPPIVTFTTDVSIKDFKEFAAPVTISTQGTVSGSGDVVKWFHIYGDSTK